MGFNYSILNNDWHLIVINLGQAANTAVDIEQVKGTFTRVQLLL